MKTGFTKFISYACIIMFLCVLSSGDAAARKKANKKSAKKTTATFESFEPVLSFDTDDNTAEKEQPEEPAPVEEAIQIERYNPTEELSLNGSPESFDSILTTWYEQNIFSSYEQFFRDFIDIDSTVTLVSTVPDSVYSARLKSILSPVNMAYNDVVKRYLITYTQSRKELMGRMIGLSQVYFPMIEEELTREELPIELRILPIIESALNPNAISRVGATGLWQFMYSTGKSYGLEITSFIDQRRDPAASTKAAVKFLKDLYSVYGDWTLAIAAYNCGPGNVNKALKRAGGDAKTFWDVYPFLPRETRGYVPSFIAATYAYTYHKQHGIEPVSPHLPIATDTIMINNLMHFDQIASTIEVPKETLRALNPQYKLDIIPALDKTYALKLPRNDVSKYLHSEQDILAKDTAYLAQYIQQSPATNQKVFNITTTTYRVKSGDTLGAIARKHGVTVNQIMSWNRLKNANVLRPGQVLEIHK